MACRWKCYVNKFSHTRFEPMGHTKNPDIRIAKSIVDYIFRWLGITFLPGYRELQNGLPAAQTPNDENQPTPTAEAEPKIGISKLSTRPAKTTGSTGTNGHAANGAGKIDSAMLERAGAAIDISNGSEQHRSEQFARFQSDAPSCDNCGTSPCETETATYAITAETAWVARKEAGHEAPSNLCYIRTGTTGNSRGSVFFF